MSDIAEKLRDRTTLRYMGDCKCGQCQLVPRALIAESADTITRLTQERDAARAELVRDGSSCGCQWTYKDMKDLDGTLARECAFHFDQRHAARAEALEEAAKVADATGNTNMAGGPYADMEALNIDRASAATAYGLAAAIRSLLPK